MGGRSYASRIIYEIVDGILVYQGWDVLNTHMPSVKKPRMIKFGKTGITLRLIRGEPKLAVPKGMFAELLQSDHAFCERKCVPGRFVEVRIY